MSGVLSSPQPPQLEKKLEENKQIDENVNIEIGIENILDDDFFLNDDDDTFEVESITGAKRNFACVDKNESDDEDEDEENKITNVTNISKTDFSTTTSKRLQFLMRFPALLQKIVNSGDVKRLRELANSAFIENVSVKTDSLKEDLIGRSHFLNFWTGIFSTVPDFVLLCKPPKLVGNLITSTVSCLGTRIMDDSMDYLFNFYECNNEGLSDEQISQYQNLKGKQMSFQYKAFLHLFLNPEMTHVVRFVSKVKSGSLCEPKHIGS